MSGKRGARPNRALTDHTLVALSVACLLMLLELSGCGGAQRQSHLLGLHATSEETFHTTWSLYLRCRDTDDPETAWRIAQRLERLNNAVASAAHTVPLPAALSRFISKPPVRTSVDPQAMAAACALHAAELAQGAGLPVAGLIYQSIIRRYREVEYAYYVTQAREGLALYSLRAFPLPRLVSSR